MNTIYISIFLLVLILTYFIFSKHHSNSNPEKFTSRTITFRKVNVNTSSLNGHETISMFYSIGNIDTTLIKNYTPPKNPLSHTLTFDLPINAEEFKIHISIDNGDIFLNSLTIDNIDFRKNAIRKNTMEKYKQFQFGSEGKLFWSGHYNYTIPKYEPPKPTLKLVEFKHSGIIDIGKPLENYRPRFKPGIPQFDHHQKFISLTPVLNDDLYNNWKLYWFNPQGNIQELNLYNILKHLNPDPYQTFVMSDRLVFNSLNHAFIKVNYDRLVEFNYQTGQIYKEYLVNGQMEAQFNTNQYLYNDKPILVNITKPITISLFDNTTQQYIQYTNHQDHNNANTYTPTVHHSGKHSPVYTQNNTTYICFMTTHGKQINGSTYEGLPGIKGSPQIITSFNHLTKIWSQPITLGYGGLTNDIHNAPALTITSKGIIYVFFGSHNDTQPTWVKSTQPHQLTFTNPSQLPKIPTKTTILFTYPGVSIGTDDTIYITYRGPWYAFSLWTFNTQNDSSKGVVLFDRKRPVTIPGHTINNDKYVAWRDCMTIDKLNNVYLSFAPKPHTNTWNSGPHAPIGSFIIVKDNSQWKLIE